MKGCPVNTKNIQNKCLSCYNKECTELDHGYFKASKINEETFEIENIKNVDYKGKLSKHFEVDIKNAELGKDYTYEVADSEDNKKAVYKMKYEKGFNS